MKNKTNKIDYKELDLLMYDHKIDPTGEKAIKIDAWVKLLLNGRREAHRECLNFYFKDKNEFDRLCDTTLNVLVWPYEFFMHFHLPNQNSDFDNDNIKPILLKHSNEIYMYNCAYDFGWDVIVKVKNLTKWNYKQAFHNIIEILELKDYVNVNFEDQQYQFMSNCSLNNTKINNDSSIFVLNDAGIIIGNETYDDLVLPYDDFEKIIEPFNIKYEENSVSENSVSENSVSENSVSENSVSENSVSENSVSENSVSENSVSENDITEKNINPTKKLNCCLDDIIKYWNFEDYGKITGDQIIKLFSKSCKIGQTKIEKYCKDNRHTIKQLNEQNQEGIRKYKQSKNYGTK